MHWLEQEEELPDFDDATDESSLMEGGPAPAGEALPSGGDGFEGLIHQVMDPQHLALQRQSHERQKI